MAVRLTLVRRLPDLSLVCSTSSQARIVNVQTAILISRSALKILSMAIEHGWVMENVEAPYTNKSRF